MDESGSMRYLAVKRESQRLAYPLGPTKEHHFSQQNCQLHCPWQANTMNSSLFPQQHELHDDEQQQHLELGQRREPSIRNNDGGDHIISTTDEKKDDDDDRPCHVARGDIDESSRGLLPSARVDKNDNASPPRRRFTTPIGLVSSNVLLAAVLLPNASTRDPYSLPLSRSLT